MNKTYTLFVAMPDDCQGRTYCHYKELHDERRTYIIITCSAVHNMQYMYRYIYINI